MHSSYKRKYDYGALKRKKKHKLEEDGRHFSVQHEHDVSLLVLVFCIDTWEFSKHCTE